MFIYCKLSPSWKETKHLELLRYLSYTWAELPSKPGITLSSGDIHKPHLLRFMNDRSQVKLIFPRLMTVIIHNSYSSIISHDKILTRLLSTCTWTEGSSDQGQGQPQWPVRCGHHTFLTFLLVKFWGKWLFCIWISNLFSYLWCCCVIYNISTGNLFNGVLMQFEFSIYYKLTTQMCTNTIQTCRPLATVISDWTSVWRGKEEKGKRPIGNFFIV